MKIFLILLINNLILKIFSDEVEYTYNKYYLCSSPEINQWDERCFQTPPSNSTYGDYKNSYQDMHYLVGYIRLLYSSNKQICNVTFITKVNPILGMRDTDYKIKYTFGTIEQDQNYLILTPENGTYPNGLNISAKITKINSDDILAILELEEEYFIWDNFDININETIYEKGQRGAIVELFGWPYDDIAEECDILKVAGYLGVKITPPNEYLLTENVIENGELNIWKYFYQTVSYKFKSRLGNKEQLKNMINKCRKNGIRIYSQVVINHMTYNGNDVYLEHYNEDNGALNTNWTIKSASGNSPFYTIKGRLKTAYSVTGKTPTFEYPSVPYCGTDFHCQQTTDENLFNGWIKSSDDQYGLIDLNTSKPYVQQRIADFFTECLSIGISGFSIFNGKYISVDDYIEIFKKLKSNLGDENFPDDFMAIFEIEFDNDSDKENYICSDNNEFGYKFTSKINENFQNDINKFKIQIQINSSPKFYNEICNNINWIKPERYVIFLENHNNHEYNENNINIKLGNINSHKNSYAEMLDKNDNNIKIKIIFSSYSLTSKGAGFPDGKSDCTSIGCDYPVKYSKAYDPLSIGYDTGMASNNFKEGNYSRIHRNLEIVNAMRKWLGLNELNDEELYRYERYKVYGYPTNEILKEVETISSEVETISSEVEAISSEIGIISSEIEIKSTEAVTISTLDIETISTTEMISSEIKESAIIISDCEEKCLSCDKDSKKLHLCKKCNEDNGYYPVITEKQQPQKYYECYKKTSTNPKRYYFQDNKFMPCYETCLTCNEGGDPRIHNCLSCDVDHMFRPDHSPETNCIAKCKFYYISSYGQYKCLDILQCPEESKLLIVDKNQCIDNCKKDNEYPYQYNGKCFEECPDNTEDKDNNKICKDIDIDKCRLSQSGIELNNISTIEIVTKTYTNEFWYTNNHISEFKNNEYDIIIYKNSDCITELSLSIPKIDFGDCYEKVKEAYNITSDLIKVVIDKLNQNNPTTSYALFHPETGEKLNAKKICEDAPIIVEENLLSLLNENDTNYNLILFLTQQNINIFNISDEFYTDICFEYESPVNKDIPLQDRLKTFYPNITLCDSGCKNAGINLDDMSVKCHCKFNDIANNDLIKENVILNSLIGEALELINESNIAVLKCYRYIIKYFTKCYGSYIILSLLFCHIILSIIFYTVELTRIKKYIFNLTENYLGYLQKSKIRNEPPKKKKKIRESNKEIYSLNKNSRITINSNDIIKQNIIKISNNLIISKKKNKILKNSITKAKLKSSKNYYTEKQDKSEERIKKLEDYFNEYFVTSIDDMDYDDAIVKDDRKFCLFFYETLKEKQIIANTFFASDPLKTRAMKIIMFILNVILYFVVNGLFYNEDYVSEVYNLEEEEKFFSFLPRSINRFIYTTVVSLIVSFVADCFFFEEKKIKGIFLREKDDRINLKTEIVKFIKELESRYFSLILIVFIILIISLYYLLCFNYVYPHMQEEWIKSSITIMIILQVLSIMTCFLESVLRFISFYYKSERIYKLSKLIN